MTPQEELSSLETSLSQMYKRISDQYKAMSKFSDNFRLDNAEKGVAEELKKVADVRKRIAQLRKQIADEWNASNKGTRFE